LNQVFWNVTSEGSPHAIILGMSGQGKSRTLMKILHQFAEKANFLAIDFHGDISEDLKGSTRVVDVKVDGLPFNPFEPPSRDQDSITQFCLDMADIFQSVCGLGAMQRVQVYKALVGSFESAEYSSNESAIPPTMSDFVSQLTFIEEQNKKVNSSARLLSVTEFQIFKANTDKDLDNLSTSVVLNLSNLLSENLKVICASLMLRKLYSSMQHRGKRESIDFGVFVDEAHLLTKDPTISKLFKESRKFGISAILASQSLSDFHPNVLDNTGLKVAFRLNNPTSVSAARFLGGPDNKNVVSHIENLAVGDCLVAIPTQEKLIRVKVF